ncbi:MAG: MFS transporter [Phycisphaerales bacterium]|nr:MFS transporter [Phycisphaerales bacterium]
MTRRPANIPQRLLSNRNFVLLWCAYGISALGDHLTEMAILKTQNAVSAAVDVTPLQARITFVFFVPFALLGPLAGMLADRFPRRALMILADVVRCAIMLVFAGMLHMVDAWGRWGSVTPLLMTGMFAALFSPARSALLPALVGPDQLARANGLISGLGIIATMAAAVLGGWIARSYAPDVAFKCDAITFAASAALVFLIRPPTGSAAPATARGHVSSWRELTEGFRYVLTHRRVLELVGAGCMVWFCGALVRSAIPAIVRDVYQQPDYVVISYYLACIGLGFVLGSVCVAVLGDALRGEVLITWGLFGVGGSMALLAASAFMGFAPTAAGRIGAVAVVLGGMSAVTVMAAFNASLQRIVPDRFRGRVFGVNDLATTASLLIATGSLALPAWEHLDRKVGVILIVVAGCASIAGFAALRIRLARAPYRAWILFLENVNQLLTKFWWRMKVVNKPTVPHQGGVLVVANHTCYGDPLLLLGAVPYRPFGFMVAKEYTEGRFLGFFMGIVDCIPVKRDGMDAGATRRAMRLLRDGGAMGIFIEGRIVPPGQGSDPKDGVAMLALSTGAKVIPAHISGTRYFKGLWKGMFVRHRARLRFGRPVDLSEFQGQRDRETVRRATMRIFEEIQELGRLDVEPDGFPGEPRCAL